MALNKDTLAHVVEVEADNAPLFAVEVVEEIEIAAPAHLVADREILTVVLLVIKAVVGGNAGTPVRSIVEGDAQ